MKHDKAIFVSGLLLTILISSVSGLLYYLNTIRDVRNNDSMTKSETPKTIVATMAPAVIDYKNNEIEVLNATKTKGLAKVYADKLILNGYKKVKTGNYTDTTDTNILYAPLDFKEELIKIDFTNYKYIKSESIKIIIGK